MASEEDDEREVFEQVAALAHPRITRLYAELHAEEVVRLEDPEWPLRQARASGASGGRRL